MHTSLVMTIAAPDRPGLVDAISTVVTEHDGNWLESRMSRLGGQFAGILRIELPSGKQESLVKTLNDLDVQGVKVVIHGDSAPAPTVGKMLSLEVVGHDRPGIVRQISHALASHGVNVEEFASEVASAAMSGEPLFKARAKVLLPANCNVELLRQELEQIAADLIVDVSLADAG